MACYCADWCTGDVSCRDGTFPTIEDCRRECHCGGKAYLCRDQATCDTIGGGCTKPVTPIKCFSNSSGVDLNGQPIGECVNENGPMYGWFHLCCTESVCPGDDASIGAYCTEHAPAGLRVGDYVTQWCYNSNTAQTRIIGHRGVYESDRPDVCRYALARKLPCCSGDGCTLQEPRTCSGIGGTWPEGDVFTENNPCGNQPETNPCNVGACCFDRTFRCEDVRPGDCTRVARTACVNSGGRFTRPLRGGVGCHRPGQCIGSGQLQPCDLDAVCRSANGDFAVSVRPDYHKPPRVKPWIEGSAEITSVNPQRLNGTGGGLEDCAYQYGDMAMVRGAPVGDSFMLATCGTPDIFSGTRVNFGPAVIRSDGNARFALAYRAA